MLEEKLLEDDNVIYVKDTGEKLIKIDIDDEHDLEDSQDIKQLAKESRFIKQLSLEIKDLIAEQGEQLGDANDNIENAIEHVQEANVELSKVKKYFFKSKLCKFTIIGTIIGFVLGLIFGITLAEVGKEDLTASIVISSIVGAIFGGISSFYIVKCKMKN